MQETTVVWEPMYEGSRLPWFTKAFVVYLAIVLFASVFRAIRLMWRLRGLRKMEQVAPTPPTSGLRFMWESCYAKTTSLKNLSVLTLLLTLLVFGWSTTRILQGVSMAKATGAAFLAGAMADVLTVSSLGILVCAALYAFAISYEATLVRRKRRFDRATSSGPLPLVEQSPQDGV